MHFYTFLYKIVQKLVRQFRFYIITGRNYLISLCADLKVYMLVYFSVPNCLC